MGKTTDNMRGALLMMGAMSAFTINDAFMKAIGSEMGVWQALFLRGCGVSVFMVLLAAGRGELFPRVPARDWWLMGGRALGELGGAILFVTALYHMPLGSLSAILQALPLTVTLAGVLFLGERMGWRRALAIAVGLCGVMLIVRPGAESFTIYSLFGVATVILVTARDIFSRMLSPAVPSLTVAATSAVGVTVATGLVVPMTGWKPVSLPEAGLLVGAMVAIAVGYVASVSAMRVGDLGFVAPFRYMSLVVAILFGMVIFSEWPDAYTVVGALIVVASGAYTFWRERRLARQPAN